MNRALCSLAVVLLAAGCSRSIDTPEAVKQGIVHDLAKRMDIQNMDVSVDSVSFRDREADAVVSFAPKGSPRSQGMSMRYKMQRTGNEWHIASRSSGDIQRHAQGGAEGSGTQLPAGHPPLGSSGTGGENGSNLPPGHPQIPSGESR
jgi:hypothetical protein